MALITLVALIVHFAISQLIKRISDSSLRIALFLAYAFCVLGTVLPNNVTIGQHVPVKIIFIKFILIFQLNKRVKVDFYSSIFLIIFKLLY